MPRASMVVLFVVYDDFVDSGHMGRDGMDALSHVGRQSPRVTGMTSSETRGCSMEDYDDDDMDRQESLLRYNGVLGVHLPNCVIRCLLETRDLPWRGPCSSMLGYSRFDCTKPIFIFKIIN